MKFLGNFFGMDVFSDERFNDCALMIPFAPYLFSLSIIERFIEDHRN
jgi:hypothetical protein